jgi:hypothetical protein
MWKSFFGFKRTPFTDNPDDKQLFASAGWQQVRKRLDFLAQNRGVGLLTGEVGGGKSTATRLFAASLHPNAFKVLYIHFTTGSAFDLLRQVALILDLQPPSNSYSRSRSTRHSAIRLALCRSLSRPSTSWRLAIAATNGASAVSLACCICLCAAPTSSAANAFRAASFAASGGFRRRRRFCAPICRRVCGPVGFDVAPQETGPILPRELVHLHETRDHLAVAPLPQPALLALQ